MLVGEGNLQGVNGGGMAGQDRKGRDAIRQRLRTFRALLNGKGPRNASTWQ